MSISSRVQLWCISCRSRKCGRSRLAPRDSWDSHTRTTDVPPRILSEMSECRFNFAHLNYNYKHRALLAGKFKLSPGIQWINSVLRVTATLYRCQSKLGSPMHRPLCSSVVQCTDCKVGCSEYTRILLYCTSYPCSTKTNEVNWKIHPQRPSDFPRPKGQGEGDGFSITFRVFVDCGYSLHH